MIWQKKEMLSSIENILLFIIPVFLMCMTCKWSLEHKIASRYQIIKILVPTVMIFLALYHFISVPVSRGMPLMQAIDILAQHNIFTSTGTFIFIPFYFVMNFILKFIFMFLSIIFHSKGGLAFDEHVVDVLSKCVNLLGFLGFCAVAVVLFSRFFWVCMILFILAGINYFPKTPESYYDPIGLVFPQYPHDGITIMPTYIGVCIAIFKALYITMINVIFITIHIDYAKYIGVFGMLICLRNYWNYVDNDVFYSNIYSDRRRETNPWFVGATFVYAAFILLAIPVTWLFFTADGHSFIGAMIDAFALICGMVLIRFPAIMADAANRMKAKQNT